MIEQILNRDFVMDQLEQVKRHLARSTDGRRAAGARLPEEARDLGEDDMQEALAALEKAEEEDKSASTGQPGFKAPPPERRGETPADIDDYSYISRDPSISNLQSALEAYFEDVAHDQVERHRRTGGRRRGAAVTHPVTDRSLKDQPSQRKPDGRRVFNKFSKTDVGWVSSVFAMGIRKLRKRHEFVSTPATPRPIADRCRVVMMGDWGSGLPRARKVAEQVRKQLDEGKAAGIEQQVVHLGDVYYSGWKREYQKRFLKHWPVTPAEAGEISSWSTNANHDMYSGGHSYYNVLLADDRFKGHEGSSLFSLVNAKWKLLGIDTAWKDHELVEPQREWILREVEAAEAAGQRVMLLSHHQPFSAFENENAVQLLASMRDLLETKRIHSWFWGHEHRCVLYKERHGLRYGRCLGHGGVPVYQWHKQDDPPKEPWIEYEYRGRFKSGLEWWANFGFAALDFDGPNIGVRYIDENGNEYNRETLV